MHDQASNIVSAGDKLMEAIESFEDVLCSAHRLKLCITHALDQEPLVSLLSAARALVGHFRRSSKVTHALL